MPYNVGEFAAEIKTKYPEYRDWEDDYLVGEVISKYPEYAEWVDLEQQPSHLSERMHDQEKNYSPALKPTGGYSYEQPPASKENPFANPQEPKIYQPNFLAPFEMPEESQEEQPEEASEEPMPEQVEPEAAQAGNPNKVIKVLDKDDYVVKIKIPGTDNWVDINGRAVKPPRRF